MTRYTNFILTVIAVSLIGILFKGSIISSAKAASRYSHWKEMNVVATNVETILADVKQLKNICRK
jgi:hypothetical protein